MRTIHSINNYEFKEISLDNYELHYTNKDGIEKVIPFKRTIELASKIQSGDANARIKLYEYLTKLGKTKNDYIIEKNVNGKIVRDETNYRELESSFMEKEQIELAMEVYKELFKIDLIDLYLDMGLTDKDQDKVQEFSLELREILINGKTKTPSIQEIKE